MRFIYIIVCLLCTITFVQGVENKILFNRLDVNNGLSSNEVTCIYKDRKGFMWFGSSSGLSRFDGYEFRAFRHEVDGALFSEAYVTQTEICGSLMKTERSGSIIRLKIYF